MRQDEKPRDAPSNAKEPIKPKPDPLDLQLLPPDAPYFSVRDVAIIYRTTPAAIRKALETKDKLGSELSRFLVPITPHRRLFDRAALMAWIRENLPPRAESA